MTWPTHQNQALRRAQLAAEGQRARVESGNGEVETERSGNEEKKQKQKRQMDNTEKVSQEKRKQPVSQQESFGDAMPGSLSAATPNSSQQYEGIAPQLCPDVAVARLAFDWIIARINMRDKQDFEDCRLVEQRKKWPDWPRFEEWWAARLSQVQLLQLSQDQKIVLKRPEPSSIADREAAFDEKTKELLPLEAQEPADTEENTELDGSDLDGLFDDGDETNLQEA
ncbi:unnamed protein product [Alternaria alternata]